MAGWIAVDLDGTLVKYPSEGGHRVIGEPIPKMMGRIEAWRAAGMEVRIFTARASILEHRRDVEAWLAEHGLAGLQVTNVKDYAMVEQWDDRAIQVAPNTGDPATQVLAEALAWYADPKNHSPGGMEDEDPSEAEEDAGERAREALAKVGLQ